MARRHLAAIALLSAVAAAGCGGGGDADKPSTEAAFKQGYSAQRAALNRVSDQIGTAITTADGKSDAEVEASLRTVQGRYHAQLAQLDALKPPDALKPDFTKVTTAAHSRPSSFWSRFSSGKLRTSCCAT